MTKFLLAALPAMTLALALPVAAQTKAPKPAADAAQTTTPMEGELAKQPDMATTEATGNADLSQLSELMAKGDRMAQKIQTISAVGSVKVVPVAKFGSDAEMKAAYDKNMVPISALQASIAANTALNAKVAAEKIEPMQIVAAEIEADGSVTLYVRDKAS